MRWKEKKRGWEEEREKKEKKKKKKEKKKERKSKRKGGRHAAHRLHLLHIGVAQRSERDPITRASSGAMPAGTSMNSSQLRS